MKLLKLTAYFSFLLAILLTTSCEKEEELEKANLYAKDGIPMTGAQTRPVISTSTATGTLSVSYDKRANFLNYTISWTGLSGNPTGIGLYGPAPEGYAALTPTGPAPPIFSASITGLVAASGKISGSVLIDGTTITEEKLLNGRYYFAIRTAAWPLGEIRGQVKFQ